MSTPQDQSQQVPPTTPEPAPTTTQEKPPEPAPPPPTTAPAKPVVEQIAMPEKPPSTTQSPSSAAPAEAVGTSSETASGSVRSKGSVPPSSSPTVGPVTRRGSRWKQITQTKVQPAIRLGKAQATPQGAVRMKSIKMDKITASTPRPTLPTPRSALHYIRDAIDSHPTEEMKEQVRRETVDPFLRNKPKLRVTRVVWVALPLVLGTTLALFSLCYGIDAASQTWKLDGVKPGHYDYRISAVVFTMFNPTPDQARPVMEAIVSTMTFIFGLLVTIIGVILQFASERITSHVTSLFFKDKIVLSSLAFVLIGNAYSLWVYLECGTFHTPRFAVVLAVVMICVQLVMLFPFLAYLFFFLDGEEVVTSIMTTGLNAVISSINKRGTNDEKNQVTATLSIEYLMAGALSSLKKKNRNITSEIIDAFCSFVMHYSAIKDRAPKIWFEIPLWIRQSPDFLILNDEAIKDLVDRQAWVEWKVLRQFQNLFVEALKLYKELCYHVCINTRIIAETAANFNQLRTIDLCIKFFNTYLRTAINVNDVRIVYTTLFQYRQLAELLLDRNRSASKELALRALKISKFIRYYAYACQTKNLFFLVETVAHDLRILCQTAIKSAASAKAGKAGRAGWNPTHAIFGDVHDRLLTVFLSIGDFSAAGGAKRGVILAEVILATYYVSEDQLVHARKIFKQLDKEENKELLQSIREELCGATTKEFWEVSERGTNFTYLEPNLRSCLFRFFAWFSWGAGGQADTAWEQSPAGKQLQQELQNFEVDLADDETDAAGGVEEAGGEESLHGDLDLTP